MVALHTRKPYSQINLSAVNNTHSKKKERGVYTEAAKGDSKQASDMNTAKEKNKGRSRCRRAKLLGRREVQKSWVYD